MRITIILSTIASIFALVSCNSPQTPQVVYDNTTSDTLTIANVLEDTTKVLVAGMPIYLDSTEVLIHPIGWEDIFLWNEYGLKLESLKKAKRVSSTSDLISTNERDYISGSMVNLIFEDMATGNQRILTDKVLIIKYVSYLKDIAKLTNKHYLLYTAYDRDYNRDGKLDGKDMEARYMSNLDGTNFKKITQDYHYFDTSELMLKNMKFYFRTLEDLDKNGKFNKKDKYHYYYIDLKDGNFTPVEYFPLELMNIEQK